uniref:Uncharacterized protein n=1 Tax=Anopheles funestus TaxID=62324 RepID=A0A182S4I4_ANOFN
MHCYRCLFESDSSENPWAIIVRFLAKFQCLRYTYSCRMYAWQCSRTEYRVVSVRWTCQIRITERVFQGKTHKWILAPATAPGTLSRIPDEYLVDCNENSRPYRLIA